MLRFPFSACRLGIAAILAVPALLLAGCQTGQPLNPNDPAQAGPNLVPVLTQDLHYDAEGLAHRQYMGLISATQYRELLAQYARGLTKYIQPNTLDDTNAWRIGDLYRNAEMWPQAEAALRVAVQHAVDQDRRVNDSLRLAEVLCEEGNVAQAVSIAQSTFSASPSNKAPILPGVLLEIVPAGLGKGDDLGLATLLEGAIRQAMLTVVDASKPPGRMFLIVRPIHIQHAIRTALAIYAQAKRPDLAKRFLAKIDPLLRQTTYL